MSFLLLHNLCSEIGITVVSRRYAFYTADFKRGTVNSLRWLANEHKIGSDL